MSKKIIDRWSSQKNKPLKVINTLQKKTSDKNWIKSSNKVHEEVFAEIDCLECANCCKSIPPIISKRDIKRISNHLNLSKKEFEEKYVITDNDGDMVFNSSPCHFLMEGNKCQIYEVRPSACRNYPHSGDYSFMDNLSLHKRNIKYCPALFEILKRLEGYI